MILIYGNPSNVEQTVAQIYSGTQPFPKLEEKIIEAETHNATFSTDRRTKEEQIKDRQVIIGMSSCDGNTSKLAKLTFTDDSCDKTISYSETIEAELYKCHTIEKDLTITFHRDYACLYNKNLTLINTVMWDDSFPDVNPKLC